LAAKMGQSVPLNFDEVKDQLNVLIDTYEKRKLNKNSMKSINEANVKKDYIDLLFEILGWNVRDSTEYDHEAYVRVGFVDITIKIKDKPVIFVEAKRFGAIPSRSEKVLQTETGTVSKDTTPDERQVLRYADQRVNVKWAILTNFERFRLFNAKKGVAVLEIDNPQEYIEKIDEIMLLTKHNVRNGNVNKLEDREERHDIDLNFLKLLNSWRLNLAREIHTKKNNLSLEDIGKFVQRVLDRLIIIRYAEDRWILDDPDVLKYTYEYWSKTKVYQKLTHLIKGIFKGFDDIHDSKIFEQDFELDKIMDLIDDNVIYEIINQLYDQSFKKFSSDILGSTYESYLANELYLNNSNLEIRVNDLLKRSGGIYYTPPHLVEYIIRNSLGMKLEELWERFVNLTDEEKYVDAQQEFDKISKIKVLDISCGSGSFLIKAFCLFKEYYERYNQKVIEIDRIITAKIQASPRHRIDSLVEMVKEKLDKYTNFEKDIITNNLFGVDIDYQAAEITSVNLVLQAIKKGEKLPLVLNENIKVGNALLSGKESKLSDLTPYGVTKLKPFDWAQNFTQIIDNGGFDVIVGNPPYFRILADNPLCYGEDFKEVHYGKMNAAGLFVNRALKLLKQGGILGMLVPKTLCYVKAWNKVRYGILSTTTLNLLIDCREAFENVLFEQVIIVLTKQVDTKKNPTYKVGRIQENAIALTGQVSQYLAKKEDTLFLEPNEVAFCIKEKMLRNVELLGKIVDVVLTYNTKGYKEYKCFKEKSKKEGDMLFLRGNDIHRYEIVHPLYFNKDSSEIRDFFERYDRLSEPHIVAQRIIAHIQDHIMISATLAETGAFSFNTTTNIFLHDKKYDNLYILALLNSKLISYYAYKFIFINSIRTMALYKTYTDKIPIHIPTKDEQDSIVALVRHIMEVKKKLQQIDTNLKSYIDNFSRAQDKTFKDYIDDHGTNRKSFIDSSLVGQITSIVAEESDKSIIIRIQAKVKKGKSLVEINNECVYQCDFDDPTLLKFLTYAINEYSKRRSGTQNIVRTITDLPIPAFEKEKKKNKVEIEKNMPNYFSIADKRSILQSEARTTDSAIDDKIYSLYGISQEEVRIIEESFT
jgi:hypothetical protein